MAIPWDPSKIGCQPTRAISWARVHARREVGLPKMEPWPARSAPRPAVPGSGGKTWSTRGEKKEAKRKRPVGGRWPGSCKEHTATTTRRRGGGTNEKGAPGERTNDGQKRGERQKERADDDASTAAFYYILLDMKPPCPPFARERPSSDGRLDNHWGS